MGGRLLFLAIFVIYGSICAQKISLDGTKMEEVTYKSLKVRYANLENEKKEIERLIEKTAAIECYSWVGKHMANFMRSLPFMGFFHDLMFGPELECENDRNDAVSKLEAKKQIKEAAMEKVHRAMLDKHPLMKLKVPLDDNTYIKKVYA